MVSAFRFTTLAAVSVIPIWWGLGGLIVATTAYFRFATKDENRPTTTFERFWLAATGFAAFELLLFVILALSPQMLAAPIAKWFQVLPAPLAAGFALAGIGVHAYKKNKAIRLWESHAYQACRTLGGIPEYVTRLGRYLHVLIDTGQQLPGNPHSELIATLAGETARELETQFQSQDQHRHEWLTLWAAVAHLSEWRTKWNLATTNFNGKVEDFHRRLTQLILSIGKRPKSMSSGIIKEADLAVGDKLVAATSEACNLWAQAIVLSLRMPHTRWRTLRKLGVSVTSQSDEYQQKLMLKIDLLVLAFFVALTIMLIPYLLIGRQAERSFGQTIWLVLMIGIIYSASVAAALGTSESKLRAPTRAALSSVIAGLAASIATILIQAAAFRSVAVSWQKFEVHWPWMLIASATAAVLSFQIHRHWRRLSWLWNGLIQTALMTLFAFAVCRMLYLLGDHKELWQWAIRVGQCGIIGFLLGSLVPSQFQAKKSNDAGGGNVLPQPIRESLERRSHTGVPWWEGD